MREARRVVKCQKAARISQRGESSRSRIPVPEREHLRLFAVTHRKPTGETAEARQVDTLRPEIPFPAAATTNRSTTHDAPPLRLGAGPNACIATNQRLPRRFRQIACFLSCSRRSKCPGIPDRREQDLLVSLENAVLAVIDLRGNNEPRYLEGGWEWSGSSHGSDSATRWD